MLYNTLVIETLHIVMDSRRFSQGPISSFPVAKRKNKTSVLGWHMLNKTGQQHGIFIPGEARQCPKTWSMHKIIKRSEEQRVDPETGELGYYYWILNYHKGYGPDMETE